ncbi:putative Zn-dependent peptidase [Caldanaerobacter subterraneus subsp. tengcongensis MB4]|uniref:Predicted Zn-dependent peptidase n=3 Tax=Caldanaerobacter subterraneus TaxID=911092 RepID=Q8R9F6_CALS4|nr:pitrilysin family protein [Caldanaerobacter subterraneus]AAM24858.1 predicted Zn-dependent peptidase [Caldanaerobacter subterraneus subsp. tengcongensis MB4]ERM92792.1 peptidase M16 [Caldanaerobacter subterraneus subsp. yonseiensis KB-1]KKC29405.1 Zn-dependent peptidase [Caldanaerobacter subterraneus subsp. pacificus DSM 12653]MCS3915572.1 putative Zn-dependent peptidase [Caldanaerobacter subterraneus subsp. tengcongensis MB4]
MELIHKELGDGINLYLDVTDKFKTVTVNLYVQNKLGDEATWYALIPSVLKRGTSALKTYKDMVKYLEMLYGTTMAVSVYKKGERHFQQYRLELPQEEYVSENVFEKGIKFLYELVFEPFTQDGAFLKEYVLQEKEVQKNLIESRINDKTKYAVDRCYEEMCKGEPFAIFELGKKEDLDLIDEKNLFEYYKKCIDTLPVDIYVVGNVNPEYAEEVFRKYFNLRRKEVLEIPFTDVRKEVKEVKYVTEELDVNQGKLTLGFRTNVPPDSEEYYPLLVYSTVLGGGPFSKLFINVREKASLAYYAYSRLERFKGLMVISSGIEVENYSKALDIILKEVGEMEKGNISDYEFDSAKKSLYTSLNAIKDNATSKADYYLSQKIAGTNLGIEEFIKKIEKVSKEDVVEVSKKVKLDTVYFMRNKKEA